MRQAHQTTVPDFYLPLRCRRGSNSQKRGTKKPNTKPTKKRKQRSAHVPMLKSAELQKSTSSTEAKEKTSVGETGEDSHTRTEGGKKTIPGVATDTKENKASEDAGCTNGITTVEMDNETKSHHQKLKCVKSRGEKTATAACDSVNEAASKANGGTCVTATFIRGERRGRMHV